jgi:hypothetical protein
MSAVNEEGYATSEMQKYEREYPCHTVHSKNMPLGRQQRDCVILFFFALRAQAKQGHRRGM